MLRRKYLFDIQGGHTSLKFRGGARKGDTNLGVTSILDDSKAVRLNEITQGMSVKKPKECTSGRSKARGQEKKGTSQCGGGQPRESQMGTMSLRGGAGPQLLAGLTRGLDPSLSTPRDS